MAGASSRAVEHTMQSIKQSVQPPAFWDFDGD